MKGQTCTFCHLCEEGVLKQRKKEKMSRIRADRKAKATNRQENGEDDDSDSDEADTGGYQDTGLSRLNSNASKASSPQASRAQSSGAEIAVSYYGAVEDGVDVTWTIDLKRLRQQHRCGMSRRFSVRVHGQDVPFVFIFSPEDGTGTSEATFRKPDQPAVLQVKCTDPLTLPAQTRFMVAFAAGSLPHRQAAQQHDFTTYPLCALPSRLALWDLVSATGAKLSPTVVAQVIFQILP